MGSSSPSSSAYLRALLFLAYAAAAVRAQEGFINIDCGRNLSYDHIDKPTGLTYTNDFAYVNSGEIHEVAPEYKGKYDSSHGNNLRSFPSGDRNCYTLKPVDKGGLYLVRAQFLYGNYDGLDSLPEFDLYLDVSFWETVVIRNASSYTIYEILAVAPANYLSLCLVHTGSGTPFVSVIDVRPLQDTMYTHANASQSLVMHDRLNFGGEDGSTISYDKDVYDRYWWSFNEDGWKTENSTRDIELNSYSQPQDVMRTRSTPANGRDLSFDLPMPSGTPAPQFYMYLHFAELQRLTENQTRIMDIYLNDEQFYFNLTSDDLQYLTAVTVYTPNPKSHDKLELSIRKANGSTLPPFINAMEVYVLRNIQEQPTFSGDADAMADIKAHFQIKNWMSDPCAPKRFIWDGLNCSYGDSNSFVPSRVISLNLASSSLIGQIPLSLENLTELTRLDLSNNSLIGGIPEFLGNLPNLTFLNLSTNNLSGSVPKSLVDKNASGTLTLSVEGNKLLGSNDVKSKSDSNKTVIVVISVCAAVALLLTVLVIVIWRFIAKKKKGTVQSTASADESNHGDRNKNVRGHPRESHVVPTLSLEKRKFTYLELVNMTDNFNKIIGRGGFGTVFYGTSNEGSPVAVKMLSPVSPQAPKQFQNEAQLLTKIHHKNLVSLIGYCNDMDHLGLIYEYMALGSLADHLKGGANEIRTLCWRDRLHISVEAAQGLQYLHDGCKPFIVHRDVKSSNILLNRNMEAKIGDFGLSRIFERELTTHVLTDVVGTPGYLDPEYFSTGQLNQKSDVYSFGVVLLELVTGKTAVDRSLNGMNLVDWVKPSLERGNLSNIVDPGIQGCNSNSVWKMLDIAMSCITPIPIRRPSMLEVLIMLRECLGLELGNFSVEIANNVSMVTQPNER